MDEMLLNTKTGQLAEYLKDLAEAQAIDKRDFKSDKKARRYIERTLHLAIECCLDIGSHIISDFGFREPVNNRDIFNVLHENELISGNLLPRLQKMAQFRNILVHDYAKIDSDIVLEILNENLRDIYEFATVINGLMVRVDENA